MGEAENQSTVVVVAAAAGTAAAAVEIGSGWEARLYLTVVEVRVRPFVQDCDCGRFEQAADGNTIFAVEEEPGPFSRMDPLDPPND